MAPSSTSSAEIRSLPERISFPGEEKKILELWEKIDAFQTSLALSKDRKPYTFYDGPPFATGLPHHGHLLAGTIKDIVTRFAHQTGHYVERRFGWDCHGLPVEYEINKKLQIHTKEQVLEMGIDAYNKECRGIVTRYTQEWERTVKRLGRWIDTKNDYKTMEPWYMESVWNVFQQLFEKNLVYRGFKILPYSTAINTSLSNFEANMDYRDVSDPAVVVSFPLVDEPEVALLAWTTTPWTLPTNMALCVNEAFTYVKIKDTKTGNIYILGEERLCQIYPKMKKKGYKGGEYEVLEKLSGKDLVGKKYQPLFDFFADWPNAFQVIADDYVTSDGGTGIVHNAPAFGEDDYRICMKYNIVGKTSLPCPIDDNGRFTSEVPFVEGIHVKEADDPICKDLKARGRLVNKESYVHSYPFCYRSGTPLIYRAIPGWFINVEAIRDKIVANNLKTYWVPAFVQEKRFHNWLVDGKDWNVSRNRFWGTPLPLWVSEDYEEVVCIGSKEELERRSGKKVEDLHREYIDDITIPSEQGKGELHRVSEVFDCWFESGSMPYAQQHYPFENKDKFENGFPADFIAEGLDQTRGWFYTLMVISTALFDKPAFKNLIVNGLVLAEDGRKMSKSLRNYTDPGIIFEEYGADALRLYLINSPVVRAEPLKFQDAGVMGVIRDVFLPWYNAARFFAQNALRLEESTGKTFVPDSKAAIESTNDMDAWIIAALQNLIKFVREEMSAYRLYTVVPRLVDFIQQLTNWYVRLNRPRLKGSDGNDAAFVALSSLYEVLYALSKLMAPFTPFFSEYMYQFLRKFHDGYKKDGAAKDEDGASDSVHYLMVPDFIASRVDEKAERRMQVLQNVIEMGRVVRERRSISLKNPVKEVTVVCPDKSVLEDLEQLKSYIHDELNMRDLVFTSEEREWCTLKAEPNSRNLGRRLGKSFGAVRKKIAQMSHDDVSSFITNNSFTIDGHELKDDDLLIKREFKGDKKIYEADVSSDGNVMVILDCREDEGLKMQGCAREFINRVQKMRKKAGLVVQDKIQVYFSEADGAQPITTAVKNFLSMISTTLGTVPAPVSEKPAYGVDIISEVCSFSGSSVEIFVVRPALVLADDATLKEITGAEELADFKSFLVTMDYTALSSILTSEGAITLKISSKAVTFQKDVHVFLNVQAKAAALKLADLEWMNPSPSA